MEAGNILEGIAKMLRMVMKVDNDRHNAATSGCASERVTFPVGREHYELSEVCGRGTSSTVYRAVCTPLPPSHRDCAIKIVNLDSLNSDLDLIINETQTMKRYHHPNVLTLHCSFVTDDDLWMVMPYVSGGSVLHIMKSAHPKGLSEASIAAITHDVLTALDYVHTHGGIHRDVKAANILVNRDGHVLLGDFGVAASLERGVSWGKESCSRKTFVGTLCWMAPEVMEQENGYDCTADIWSVGMTLLELAYGSAPLAKFPPMKVLSMTLDDPPPKLTDTTDKRFSDSLRDLVSRCLQKDPRNRPSARQLLCHPFLQARDVPIKFDVVTTISQTTNNNEV